MGVLDKFMDFMKMDNADDGYEDDFYDEEAEGEFYDDDYEEQQPTQQRPSFFGKKASKQRSGQYDDFEEEQPVSTAVKNNNKITPMRSPGVRNSGATMEVCVVKPSTVDDSREITETLLKGRTVILNLEGMDLEIAQRIIDFISGAAFAINGNLQKISNYIFLVTPTNVDISGDLQDLLNTSMEEPVLHARY